MPVLTYVDVLRIQSFVFASNRLRDVVAGSALVAAATGRATLERHARPTGKVVFCAGGNALLAFPDLPEARRFAAGWSRELLDRYPGLEAEAVHQEYAPGGWREAFARAGAALVGKKLSRRPSAPLRGLSVTAECVETRDVATYRDRSGGNEVEVAISASLARRRAVPKGAPEKAGMLGARDLLFPRELDDLGRSRGDTSLIAVVHVDGNSVGMRVREWLDAQAEQQADDDELQRRQGVLANEISAVGAAAQAAVLEKAKAACRMDPDSSCHGPWLWSQALGTGFRLAEAGGVFLPVRPVLLGGDDLTFVCEGRIGIALAAEALEVFSRTTVPSFGRPLGAAAGVALVKSHAPFARAYEMAESLCRSAKAKVRGEDEGYAIDWHIGYFTPSEPLAAVRDRSYRAGALSLTMRPYSLNRGTMSARWLLDELLWSAAPGAGSGFQRQFWQEHRSKMKDLRGLLRGGPDVVREALAAWRVTADLDADLDVLPGGLGTGGGFQGSATPLIDALELVDIHFPI